MTRTFIFGVAAFAAAAFQTTAAIAGGRVTVSGGPLPNPPICTAGPCVFLNEGEYAQNGVGITLRNEAAYQRIVEQSQARSVSAMGLPLGKGPQDKQWFFDWLKVSDVTQEVELEAPTLAGSTSLPVYRFPTRYRNCGSQKSETTQTSTVRTREEITKEIEETSNSVITSERQLSVNANFSKAVSASAASKITTSLTTFRRNLTKRMVEHEFTSQTTDPIVMPPNSMVDRSVVQRSSIDTYVAKGIVTTDARLYLPIIRNMYIGKWSDFAPPQDRQIDVQATTRVLVRDTEYDRSTSVFASEAECKAAR